MRPFLALLRATECADGLPADFNIVPYDLTRVKLPDRGRDDFVNASWIEEPFLGVGTSQQKWIASQVSSSYTSVTSMC